MKKYGNGALALRVPQFVAPELLAPYLDVLGRKSGFGNRCLTIKNLFGFRGECLHLLIGSHSSFLAST